MRIPEGRYHIGTNGEGYPLCKCLPRWFVEACEISVAKSGYNVEVYFGQETPSSTFGTRKGQLWNQPLVWIPVAEFKCLSHLDIK